MANLSKRQIVSEVAKHAGVSGCDTQRVLSAFILLAHSEVRNNGSFAIDQLGKLIRVNRPARNCRNPKTGETIRIESREDVKFRVSNPAKRAMLS